MTPAVGRTGAFLACCLLLGVALLTAGLVVAGARVDHGVAIAAVGAVVSVLAAGMWGWSGRHHGR